jgi:hypothetical protein
MTVLTITAVFRDGFNWQTAVLVLALSIILVMDFGLGTYVFNDVKRIVRMNKLDRKTRKLLDRQENLGNKIFNALEKIVSKKDGLTISKTDFDQNGFDMCVNLNHYIDYAGVRWYLIMRININALLKSITVSNVTVYMYPNSASEGFSLEEAESQEFLDRIINYVKTWEPPK